MYTRERWLFRPFTARTRACHNGSTNWIKDSLAVRGITRDWRRARRQMMDYYPKWTVSPEGILASAGIRTILWRYYGGSERIRRRQMMSTKSANLHHVGFDILFNTDQYFAPENSWETKKSLRTTKRLELLTMLKQACIFWFRHRWRLQLKNFWFSR